MSKFINTAINQSQSPGDTTMKNLPLLKPTDIVEKGEFIEFLSKKGVKKRQPKWYYEALNKARTPQERRTLRSKTFEGMAKAIANQWTL